MRINEKRFFSANVRESGRERVRVRERERESVWERENERKSVEFENHDTGHKYNLNCFIRV